MPSGTVMKDLSILKDKPDPIAMPDEEYPSWLWTLTDEALAEAQHGKKAAELDAEGGLAVGDASGKVGVKGDGFDRQAERRKLRSRWVVDFVVGRWISVGRADPGCFVTRNSNKAEIKARNFLSTT